MLAPIQIILLAVFAPICVLSVAAFKLRRLSPATSIAAAALSLAACIAALFPDLTTKLAKLVGIDRGADLIVYTTAVIVFVGFLGTYSRLRRVRADLTRLTREIAIREAHTNQAPPTSTTTDQHADDPSRPLPTHE